VVWGLGFGDQGLGVGVEGSGFGVQGLGFRVSRVRYCTASVPVRFVISGLGCKVWDLGSVVQDVVQRASL
jgi:hypothetical protein